MLTRAKQNNVSCLKGVLAVYSNLLYNLQRYGVEIERVIFDTIACGVGLEIYRNTSSYNTTLCPRFSVVSPYTFAEIEYVP